MEKTVHPGHTVEKVELRADSVGEITVPLTGQQRAAFWLAVGVGASIFLTIAFLLVLLWRTSPPAPVGPPKATDYASYKAWIEQHNILSDAAYERTRNIFQAFVASALLPVFTGIVGFIIGRGERGS
jgi:hypothetical protein